MPPSPTPERHAAQSLPAASMLAFTGGYLDAFLYIGHGHVFAGAMTGNLVLFGIALLSGKLAMAVHHSLPLIGFVVGVLLAHVLESHPRHHAPSIALALEATAVFVASWLPGSFPEFVFIPVLACVAAFQVTTFRKVDTYAYNSSFITGNMRSALAGVYAVLSRQNPAEGWRQFRDLGFIVLAFLLGVVAGATLTQRFANHALWLPCLILCVVLLMVLRLNRLALSGRIQ